MARAKKVDYDSLPCECNPERPARERCTKGGWIRCNKRLGAYQKLKKKQAA